MQLVQQFFNGIALPLVDIVLQSTNFFAYSGRLCMILLSLYDRLINSFGKQRVLQN